jgi:hypothetical protein
MRSKEYDWKNVWDDGSMDGGEFYGMTIFYDSLSCRYSARDMSGELPEDTDDGVLWLDFSRKFKLIMVQTNIHIQIPVFAGSYESSCSARANKLDSFVVALVENNCKPDIIMTPEVRAHINQALRIHEAYENCKQ